MTQPGDGWTARTTPTCPLGPPPRAPGGSDWKMTVPNGTARSIAAPSKVSAEMMTPGCRQGGGGAQADQPRGARAPGLPGNRSVIEQVGRYLAGQDARAAAGRDDRERAVRVRDRHGGQRRAAVAEEQKLRERQQPGWPGTPRRVRGDGGGAADDGREPGRGPAAEHDPAHRRGAGFRGRQAGSVLAYRRDHRGWRYQAAGAGLQRERRERRRPRRAGARGEPGRSLARAAAAGSHDERGYGRRREDSRCLSPHVACLPPSGSACRITLVRELSVL